ncbi:MAG: hypothetical protein IPM39_14920 [Chloroflexi bacterium]|nr:hypothetical protein [Chloroflexota bacterium]
MSAADEVYQEKHTAVRHLIANMVLSVEAHRLKQQADPNDWGYVGDLAHVEERLKEVVGFLRPVEEAA